MAEDTRVFSQRYPPLQPFTTRAWIHITALPLSPSRSLAHPDALLITSCVCQSKSIFLSFFLCLLPPSINSLVAEKLFVTPGACEEGWFVEINSTGSQTLAGPLQNPLEFHTMLRLNVRGSVVTQTTRFICMSKSCRRIRAWHWSGVMFKSLSSSKLFKKVKTNQ